MLDELLDRRLSRPPNHRELRPLSHYDPRLLRFGDGGSSRLNFSSNDYLGLSRLGGRVDYGSQPSSRLLGGNLALHEDLEVQLARWLEVEAGLLYPTGMMANLGLLSCIATRGDLILLDKFSHASLLDGAQLSQATWKRFRHNDLGQLQTLIENWQPKVQHIFVVTESLFSMDGDRPDFAGLARLKAQYGFSLIVDEAHAIGVYGSEGRGLTHEHAGLADILTFSLSKSFALQGGVVAGSASLKRFLVNRSRAQIYTTATPAGALQLLPQRLQALRAAGDARAQLEKLCQSAASAAGIPGPWSPIVPIHIGPGDLARRLAEELWARDIYAPAVLPPTVPEKRARLRISLNACHREEDLARLFQVLRDSGIAWSGTPPHTQPDTEPD